MWRAMVRELSSLSGHGGGDRHLPVLISQSHLSRARDPTWWPEPEWKLGVSACGSSQVYQEPSTVALHLPPVRVAGSTDHLTSAGLLPLVPGSSADWVLPSGLQSEREVSLPARAQSRRSCSAFPQGS